MYVKAIFMKQQYRSIFISDLHLGVSTWQVKILLDWLKENSAKNYYFVGDIVDLWKLKRSWYWCETYNTLLRKIVKFAEKKNVVFIPGNHDSSFRDFIGNSFCGIKIKDECIHECINGKKILITHGDKFDSIVQERVWLARWGSIGYELLLKLNRFVTLIRKLVGFKKYWSLSAAVKKKVKEAVKYVSKFEEALADYAKSQDTHGVICGHLHMPNMYFIKDIAYLNIGDFLESLTVIVEKEDGTFELLVFKHHSHKDPHVVSCISIP